MNEAPKILLFIPAYNCAPEAHDLFHSIWQNCYSFVDQILYLDNQSTDGTVETVSFLKKHYGMSRLIIATNERNYGLGGSHKVAFDYALSHGFDYIVVLHGDNQADPYEVQLLVAKIFDEPYLDAVLGSRFDWQSHRKGYSRIRSLGNFLLNGLYSLLMLRSVKDLGSGLNLFRVSSLKQLPYHQFSDKCDFNIHLLLSMLANHWKLKYFPISWREEGQRSNVNTFAIGCSAVKHLLSWKFMGARSLMEKPIGRSFVIAHH